MVTMDWSEKRKIMYAAAFLFVLISGGIFGFRKTLFPDPTCVDTKQNGYETGVDCGGECARKCIAEITPIHVDWARALPISSGVYDLVGFLSNHNSDSAPLTLTAVFNVYDQTGKPIYTKRVNTTPPAATDFPVIIQNVYFSSPPKTVTVTLEEGTWYRIPSRFESTQISTVQTRFENGDTPRVYATLRNLTRESFGKIPVRVVLYDITETAIGSGETILDGLNKEETKDVVFTWKEPFKEPPVLIRVYPILDAFN